MDTITPVAALVVAVIAILGAALLVRLQKKRDEEQWYPIDITHYFDPKTNVTAQIHRFRK